MARTGRSFPSPPIVLHGRVVPAAPTVTRPAGVTFIGQVENQREGRMRRDTTLVQINQSRIAAAPIPTNHLLQPIVVGQAKNARSGRQRAKTRIVTLRGVVSPAAAPSTTPALQPVVVLADHTKLPRSPLERITITRGVVAPAAPPPTPRIIQPVTQEARSRRPSSARVLVLHPPTIAIVRPPTPIVAGFPAERRPAPRVRSHITILKGSSVPAAVVVTKPVQIVALTRLPRGRCGQAHVLIQHGRVFVAPSGVGPPTTCATGVTSLTGRTTIRGMEQTTVTASTATSRIDAVPSLTSAAGTPSRTDADCG